MLISCRKVFRVIRLCDEDLSFRNPSGTIDFIWQFFLAFVEFLVIIGMIAFCITKTEDLLTLLNILYTIVGTITYEIVYCSIVWKRPQIRDLMKHFEGMLIQRIKFNPAAKRIHEEQEAQNFSLTKKLIIYAVLVVSSLCFLPFLNPLIFFVFGSPTPDKWSLPFNVVWVHWECQSFPKSWPLFFRFFLITRSPFNANNIIGYYVIVILQWITCCLCLTTFTIILSFYIGSCEYINAFISEFESITDRLNNIMNNGSENSRKNKIEIKNVLRTELEYHIDVLE